MFTARLLQNVKRFVQASRMIFFKQLYYIIYSRFSLETNININSCWTRFYKISIVGTNFVIFYIVFWYFYSLGTYVLDAELLCLNFKAIISIGLIYIQTGKVIIIFVILWLYAVESYYKFKLISSSVHTKKIH